RLHLDWYLFSIISQPDEHTALLSEKALKDSWFKTESLEGTRSGPDLFAGLDLHGDVIGSSAVIDREVHLFSDLQSFGTNEVKRRNDVLDTKRNRRLGTLNRQVRLG